MSRYYSKIILAATVILAALLRLFSPFKAPAISTRDYWYDEAFTGILLKESWASMNDMIFRDVHPPLYYWLAKLWSAPLDYSPFGIRSFSAAMGLLSVVSIYWIGKKMFSERAGVLAAIITAFSPFAVEYSQEARMYALFGLLMLWAMYFFYQGLETGLKKHWIAWGVLGGLSFYTHYLSLFFFVLFYVAYVLYQFMNRPDAGPKKNVQTTRLDRLKAFFGSRNFWIGTGVIIVFFLTWSKIFITHIKKGNLGWIDPAQLSDIPKTLQIFFFGHPAGTGGVPWSNEFRYFFDGTSVGLIVFALITTLLTTAFLRRIHRNQFMVLTTLSFGTLLFLILLSHGIDGTLGGKQVTFSIKLYVARYFMPAALFVYLLVAGLVEEVIDRRIAWVSFLVVYVALLLMLKPMQFAQGWSVIDEMKDVIFKPDQLIVTANPFEYSSARYYFGEDRVRLYNKNNPGESFAGWVVVGDHNKINDLQELKDNPEKYIIVDDTCEWNGIGLDQYLPNADERKMLCKVSQ